MRVRRERDCTNCKRPEWDHEQVRFGRRARRPVGLRCVERPPRKGPVHLPICEHIHAKFGRAQTRAIRINPDHLHAGVAQDNVRVVPKVRADLARGRGRDCKHEHDRRHARGKASTPKRTRGCDPSHRVLLVHINCGDVVECACNRVRGGKYAYTTVWLPMLSDWCRVDNKVVALARRELRYVYQQTLAQKVHRPRLSAGDAKGSHSQAQRARKLKLSASIVTRLTHDDGGSIPSRQARGGRARQGWECRSSGCRPWCRRYRLRHHRG